MKEGRQKYVELRRTMHDDISKVKILIVCLISYCILGYRLKSKIKSDLSLKISALLMCTWICSLFPVIHSFEDGAFFIIYFAIAK